MDSILESTYKDFEIIVVDDNSTDNTFLELKKRYAGKNQVTVFSSPKNLGAGGARNLGVKNAKGKYLLFIDNDNIIDKKMIDRLVDFFDKTPNCGMVGPLMLYKEDPSLIWLYFADINMWTSMARYKGTLEKDKGQYPKVVKVGHLPNCFMMLREDFEGIGGFDEKFIIMYEEADIAEKIKKQLKKNIYIFTKAVTRHNVEKNPKSEQNTLGLRSTWRAFLVPRNRIYFMKKNADFLQKLAFFSVFNNVIFVYYVANLVLRKRFDFALAYIKGFFAGFFL